MSQVRSLAEQGLFERLRSDSALVALIGSGTRIVPGWPGDTTEATDFPRITFYIFGPGPRRPGFERIRAALDLWVWPTGATGGRAKLLAVDSRISALFDEQMWTYGSARMWTYSQGFRDQPGGPGTPLRRTHEIVIEASLSAAS